MVRGWKKRSSSSSRSSMGRPVTSMRGMERSDGVLGFADRSIAGSGGRMTTTVGGLLDRHATEHGDRLFLWCGDDRMSYAQTAEAPTLRRIVAFDDVGGSAIDGVSYAKVRACETSPPNVDLTGSSLLSIMYTSGTTGMPKGCMLAHGWYVNGARGGTDMMGYGGDDVLYTALPLFHAWAQGMVMGALLHGLTAVVDPMFSASTVLRRLAETNAPTFARVGAMGVGLLA